MITLEDFENTLCVPCGWCEGTRQEKAPTVAWCRTCGGSGLNRTVTPSSILYLRTSDKLPPPYLRSDNFIYTATGVDGRWLRDIYPLPETSSRWGCYLIDGDNEASNIARGIEAQVFEQFFGTGPQELANDYLPYEWYSKFFVLFDKEKNVAAGAMRIITVPNFSEYDIKLKTLVDLETLQPILYDDALKYHGIVETPCWDVGSVAVLPQYRGAATDHYVSTALYGILHRTALRREIKHFVATLDQHAYKQLTEIFHLPFVPIMNSVPFPWMGSPVNHAVYAHVPDMAPELRRYADSLDTVAKTFLQPYVTRMLGDELPEIVPIE